MKLIGRDVSFQITPPGSSITAGAHFNDVTFNEEGQTIDVSTAGSHVGQQRVDDNSSTANISATGFLDTVRGTQANGKTYFNFVDLAIVGRAVNVVLTVGGNSTTPTTTMNVTNKLAYYAPWQISKASFKHGKRAASEDTIELVGTGGAIPTNYQVGQAGGWNWNGVA